MMYCTWPKLIISIAICACLPCYYVLMASQQPPSFRVIETPVIATNMKHAAKRSLRLVIFIDTAACTLVKSNW